MDLLIWAAMLVVMAVASYRSARLWRGTTTAFDAWPAELQRAAPATVWFGTAFFAGGAVLVLGDFGPGHPISIVAALVAVVGGWPRSAWAHRCSSVGGRAGSSLRTCARKRRRAANGCGRGRSTRPVRIGANNSSGGIALMLSGAVAARASHRRSALRGASGPRSSAPGLLSSRLDAGV
jgi:hypothetical protein